MENLTFEALKNGLAMLGVTDDKQVAKVAKAVKVDAPKASVERFTLTDTPAGKRLVMRNPGVKGKPRTINPSELSHDLANARRIVADLEEAEAYLHANNVL